MDTNTIIQGVIIGVVSGLLLLIAKPLIPPIRAATGAIYKRLVSWVCQLFAWVRQLVSRIRQFLFVKPYCKKKRRLFAVCDVLLEDLDKVGVDTSKYQPQLGESKVIDECTTVTVDAKDVEKIKSLKCLKTLTRDDYDVGVLDRVGKEYVFPDKEFVIPCFVDETHGVAKSMKQLKPLRKKGRP